MLCSKRKSPSGPPPHARFLRFSSLLALVRLPQEHYLSPQPPDIVLITAFCPRARHGRNNPLRLAGRATIVHFLLVRRTESECCLRTQKSTDASTQHAQRSERRTGRLHRALEPELDRCAFCNVSLESMRNLTSPPPLNIERPQSRLALPPRSRLPGLPLCTSVAPGYSYSVATQAIDLLSQQKIHRPRRTSTYRSRVLQGACRWVGALEREGQAAGDLMRRSVTLLEKRILRSAVRPRSLVLSDTDATP